MEYKDDYLIILAIVWAVTFPLLAWLTYRLIEKVHQARSRIEEIKALWYTVDQLNSKMVEKARAKGIQIVPGPIRPPYEEIFERRK